MRFVFIIFGKRCDCDGGVTGGGVTDGGGYAALGPGAEVAECGVGEEVREGYLPMDTRVYEYGNPDSSTVLLQMVDCDRFNYRRV